MSLNSPEDDYTGVGDEEVFVDLSDSDSDEDPQRRRTTTRKFRLLIIGKSGCGKTTILSKVCGEEVADKPSTTRGFHNIERGMEFKGNKLFIVHDSEGFEAGQNDELVVVTNFIKARGNHRDPNERLHAIWYCLTTNSRPIQQAEEDFFSVKHDVPIIAIFTKFDLFVLDQLQELMDDVNEDELDEEFEAELEQKARETAIKKFEQHFKGALMKKKYAPQAVISLEDVPGATLANARLTRLIGSTMSVLEVEPSGSRRSKKDQKDLRSLAILFAAAQKADLYQKYRASFARGLPGLLAIGKERKQSDYERPKLIRIWENEYWTSTTKAQIISAFEEYVENYPGTFGNSDAPKERRGNQISPPLMELYRCLQLASNLTAIMTEIFLLKAKDTVEMRKVIKKFTDTAMFNYIRDKILELDGESKFVKVRWAAGGFYDASAFKDQCANIADNAVRSYLLANK